MNHRPFVRAVEVYQRSQVQYSAIWEDNDKIKPGTETVSDVADRTFKIESDRLFMEGAATVAIKFSEPVNEVRVTVGKQPPRQAFRELQRNVFRESPYRALFVLVRLCPP
ncbi:MAG TPA: hypothetical protein VMW46_00130 [Candidatus Desulfaltia sp.]|nr:hypothetical protein [Candidatus Desulfaltia sp.]